MSAPYCAECGGHVAPDLDYIHVEAETRKIGDRNDLDTYYFHPECWWGVVDEWRDPA